MIASPCVNVCVMDQTTGLCAGCARTIAEIAAWAGLSQAEQRGIIAALPARRAAAEQERKPHE